MNECTIHGFEADMTSGREGDSVTLRWECGCPDSVTLTVNNGYRKDSTEVGYDGSTRILLSASKGRTVFTLTARTNGKAEERTVTVRVKSSSVPEQSGISGVFGRLKRKVESLKAWWAQYRYRLRYAWRICLHNATVLIFSRPLGLPCPACSGIQ